MASISILLPHKHEHENDQALKIAIDCIIDNTTVDYELLIDSTTPADPYVVLNSLAARARSEWIFFANSDLFMAPGWDIGLLDKAEPGVMVCPCLVEPYAIGVWPGNITRDMGMRPDTFDRQRFEMFAQSKPPLPDYDPFYYYVLMSRRDFLADGGYNTKLGSFPEPLDIHYWDKWLKRGRKIVRGYSFAYHLQNWSNPEEQRKAVRWKTSDFSR